MPDSRGTCKATIPQARQSACPEQITIRNDLSICWLSFKFLLMLKGLFISLFVVKQGLVNSLSQLVLLFSLQSLNLLLLLLLLLRLNISSSNNLQLT